MNEILAEAFKYSAWATTSLITAATDLSDEQLHRPGRGFGSILATLNHIVLSDGFYAAALVPPALPWVAEKSETNDLAVLQERADDMADRWTRILTDGLDSERSLLLDRGSYECHASVVVVQAIHHANAHREQVRFNLRDLGARVPDVQPWEYALDADRGRNV